MGVPEGVLEIKTRGLLLIEINIYLNSGNSGNCENCEKNAMNENNAKKLKYHYHKLIDLHDIDIEGSLQ